MSDNQQIEWLNLVEKTGPFLAVGVLDEEFKQGLAAVETLRRQRVRSAYDEWRDAIDAEDPQLSALHREWLKLVLEELLEYDGSVLKSGTALPVTLSYRDPISGVEVRPDFAVMANDSAKLLISTYAPDSVLKEPTGGDAWLASPIDRMTQLCRATGTRAGLVTNGERWTLVSVPENGASSVATWFARIWQQEPVTLQAFVSLLGVRRCFAASGTLESLLTKSLEHQNDVTDTLGEQVRRAVEVLVQSLDRADLDRDRQLLKEVSPAQLYEAGLTVMMRLVVILCAEERGLLLLGEPTYDQHYAVSTLRARLIEDKNKLGEEVLERRHDAWSRLLAVFRAVFGGVEHETLRMPPLGGSLFDPDRFPFLEGRALGTAWRDTPATPLPIDNRTVLMLLTALQVLEQKSGAQLLSYEALDVEQIGHVYEGLLERTVKRVPEVTLGLLGSQKVINPTIPLRELEEDMAAGLDTVVAKLAEATERTESTLKKALTKSPDDTLKHQVELACGNDSALTERVLPLARLLRADNWGHLLVYPKDAFIVTMGANRRETGTHYTPKSLTEPIVQHTLEPIVYTGPAEGLPREEWKLKSPADLLALKICDMAMGSAAFLVQTCRWLAERVVEAWGGEEKAGRSISVEGVVLDAAGTAELLPHDNTDRILIARRLVASRCLYGVDINPMAVELGKVSLWLVTMMKGRPFGFVDHALKCGDSLIGVSSVRQIENFSLRPGERQVTFATANLSRYVDEASAKRRALESLPSNDHSQIEIKNSLHAQAEAASSRVKAVADCLIAFELRGLDGGAYENQRTHEAEKVQILMKRDHPASLNDQKPTINELSAYARGQMRGRRPFHWPVEFPEVFAGGGFDAFVGNPPFMGGRMIGRAFSDEYHDFLGHIRNHVVGSPDLCAYFFLRAFTLLGTKKGTFGLMATKTISETGTRVVCLDQLINQGAIIYRANSRYRWPGKAAVFVSVVHVVKSAWIGTVILDDKIVSSIDGGLDVGVQLSKPEKLPSMRGRFGQGQCLMDNGGFQLNQAERDELIALDARSDDLIMPLFNGKDLNSIYDFSPNKWVINFRQMNESDARSYPAAFKFVEERVKKYRDGLTGQIHERCFWRFWDYRSKLVEELSRHTEVMASSRRTKFVVFRRVPTNAVYTEATKLFLFFEPWEFAVLQSTFHQDWAAWRSATIGETTFAYSTSEALETWPMPTNLLPAQLAACSKAGAAYHDARERAMRKLRVALTDLYNDFHKQKEQSDDMARLRALHVEMDQAVAAAYGWSDLELGHGFYLTKQGERFTISESAQRVVLDRILALNHQRYAEEIAAGLLGKTKGNPSASNRTRSKKTQEEAELF